MLCPSATTNYGGRRPPIASLWPQKYCGLRPQWTIVAEGRKWSVCDFNLATKVANLATLIQIGQKSCNRLIFINVFYSISSIIKTPNWTNLHVTFGQTYEILLSFIYFFYQITLFSCYFNNLKSHIIQFPNKGGFNFFTFNIFFGLLVSMIYFSTVI